MTAAVIQADFVDTRRVKTRKVLQIIFEVPIEHEPRIMGVLGWPNPAQGLPVAIARLNGPSSVSPTDVATPLAEAKVMDKPRALSQEAALLCRRSDFQSWLSVGSEEDAATRLRTLCQISSRSELDTNEAAAIDFNDVVARFNEQWKRA